MTTIDVCVAEVMEDMVSYLTYCVKSHDLLCKVT